MGQKDIITKKYLSDAAIFADIFNYFIYDGEQVIKPEDLQDMDTTEVVLPYGDSNVSKPVQRFRDILKSAVLKSDNKFTYLILGIENQMNIHYAMPVRNALYDIMQYASQVEALSKTHKTGEDKLSTGDEFLSGVSKNDKLRPVITLVVYFGAKDWDAPMSIHDMLESGIDERVLKYIPDYKLNLICPSRMSDEDFKKFCTDLSKVLKFVKLSEDKQKLREIIKDTSWKSVSREAVEVIRTVTSTNISIVEDEEGNVNMCKGMEDLINEGRQEGRQEGSKEQSIKTAKYLLSNTELSIEQVSEASGLSAEEVKKLK